MVVKFKLQLVTNIEQEIVIQQSDDDYTFMINMSAGASPESSPSGLGV